MNDGYDSDDDSDTFAIKGVRVIRETENALCCVGESGRERWVPKAPNVFR